VTSWPQQLGGRRQGRKGEGGTRSIFACISVVGLGKRRGKGKAVNRYRSPSRRSSIRKDRRQPSAREPDSGEVSREGGESAESGSPRMIVFDGACIEGRGGRGGLARLRYRSPRAREGEGGEKKKGLSLNSTWFPRPVASSWGGREEGKKANTPATRERMPPSKDQPAQRGKKEGEVGKREKSDGRYLLHGRCRERKGGEREKYRFDLYLTFAARCEKRG